jgi:hypothetical protein
MYLIFGVAIDMSGQQLLDPARQEVQLATDPL